MRSKKGYGETMKKLLVTLLLVFALFLTACGGEEPTDAPEPTDTPAVQEDDGSEDGGEEDEGDDGGPATPAAEFTPSADSGPFEGSEDEEVIQEGKKLYERPQLNCTNCHGDEAEGTDDGGALAGLDIPYEEFEKALREGVEGVEDHKYSATGMFLKVTDEELQAIYSYLSSLEAVEGEDTDDMDSEDTDDTDSEDADDTDDMDSEDTDDTDSEDAEDTTSEDTEDTDSEDE
jgi:mono/diheme cytochrome c family protein